MDSDGIDQLVLNNNMTDVNIIKNGALFGLVVYGTYNGTNFATIEKWNYNVSSADTIWGMIICSITSYIVFNLQKKN